MDYNPSGSSAHGILQARILGEPEYLLNPGIELVSLMPPALAAGFFTTSTPWASLEVQMVKNLPVMQETWVQSLGWEDPLEKGIVTHSSILAWKIP